MMHLLEGNRKKSPEPSPQSDPFGGPADITAGTRNLPCRDLEVDQSDLTIPPDEGGGAGPWITFQDGIDVDPELPALAALTPGFAILDAPPAKGINDIDIGQTEASRGVRRYDDSVGSYLPCGSREESSWSQRSCHRELRSPQSRPGSHPCPLCQSRGSLSVSCSEFSFGERISRESLL